MPRDAVSRTANVERTGRHKWDTYVLHIPVNILGQVIVGQFLPFWPIHLLDILRVMQTLTVLQTYIVGLALG